MPSQLAKLNCAGSSSEKQVCECARSSEPMLDRTRLEKPTEMNSWSEWSECSVKCGNGVRTRSRRCSIRQDVFCRSSSELIREQTTCSGNCSLLSFWSEWTAWSKCSSSCGDGFMIRKRICNTRACTGNAYETKSCTAVCSSKAQAIKAALVEVGVEERKVYELTDWSKWSGCLTKHGCGKGVRTRKRSCTLDGKLANGFECDGATFEMAECHLGDCESGSYFFKT